ncbi:hypothetical protein [Nostoc sp.]|uniref:hypothetical protein n=1 Tax=Nostoc sp. TaxID=1180 RepID=UPI002FF977D3
MISEKNSVAKRVFYRIHSRQNGWHSLIVAVGVSGGLHDENCTPFAQAWVTYRTVYTNSRNACSCFCLGLGNELLSGSVFQTDVFVCWRGDETV